MSKYVLDASALLVLINSEPGCDQITQYLSDGCMSVVNVSEVAAILHGLSMPHNEIGSLITYLIPSVIPFDLEQAYMAAQLRMQTAKYGLSLGDRACLSLGKLKSIPVVTADKIWMKLSMGLEVILVR